MIVPADIARKHRLTEPYVEYVAVRVRDIVRAYCEDQGFAYTGRTKDIESLSEKIESGRFRGWSELDDFFACTIIVPTLSNETAVLDYLESQFAVHAIRRRSDTQKDPSVFRFDATRFIGKIRPAPGSDPATATSAVLFEVQVRSAFEHAWSVTTHALAYKCDHVDWRRLRVAAQLKAAVEQLDGLIAGYEQATSVIVERRWPEIAAKKRIEEVMRVRFEDGTIPSELCPKSWSRFCDNVYSAVISTSSDFVRDPLSLVNTALQAIDLEAVANKGSFPRSISLVQFCLGALASRGIATGTLKRYVPLLTTELTGLFPSVSILGKTFDCEFSSGSPVEPTQPTIAAAE